MKYDCNNAPRTLPTWARQWPPCQYSYKQKQRRDPKCQGFINHYDNQRMKMGEREIEFWAIGDKERLRHENIHEAVEDHLYNEVPLDEPLPEKVYVQGYARMKASIPHSVSPLEMLIEYLDEEYGDPEGGNVDTTDRMHQAEREFINTVLEECTPWCCEPVGDPVEIDVQQWLQEEQDSGS